MTERTERRAASAIDRIADSFVESAVELSPTMATYLGIAGHDEDYDDFSPAGYAAQSELRRSTLAALDQATPIDAVDSVTLAAMRERLGLAEEIYAAGLEEMALNVIASPLQGIREVYDLMPTDTDDQWRTIVTRMEKLPAAIDGYIESLRAAASAGNTAPRRQVIAGVEQIRQLTADDGYFAELLAGAKTSGGPLAEPTAARLAEAVAGAATAYAGLATFLEDELLYEAPHHDACGQERYALWSREFLGAPVDLAETYEWGQEELARITAEMEQIAEGVRPGLSVADAVAHFDDDPTYQLDGTDELRTWMQGKADEAIGNLADRHFDIPPPVRRIECMIAPTHTGGIYYTGPSEDFSRPGRMWWSVPRGVERFSTWRELTTVYHEGVPGHHLQIAQTMVRAETLNRWRRLMAWTAGHGEGWALYAERLMADLGYLDDPGSRFGMLDGQSMRAARVVLDIGIHCGFEAPDSVGGGDWDYDKAWRFLTAHAHEKEEFLRFELDRYLGWPGQAPSYKIGERLWLQLRDELRRRDGAAFDLKAFHRRALDLGGLGLDVLRAAVLGTL